jgi:hypothetical protein
MCNCPICMKALVHWITAYIQITSAVEDTDSQKRRTIKSVEKRWRNR